MSPSKKTKEEVENSIWHYEQGKKSFPLLLEVIRREEGNLGAVRIDKALARVMRYPGDKSAFVEEVRRRLPEWKNAGFEPKQYNNMATMSFRLLAEEGDESDIALIESMLDADPKHPIYQEQIARNVKALKERLAKVKQRPDKRNSGVATSPSVEDTSRGQTSAGAKNAGNTDDTPWPNLWILMASALVIPLIILAVRRKKR